MARNLTTQALQELEALAARLDHPAHPAPDYVICGVVAHSRYSAVAFVMHATESPNQKRHTPSSSSILWPEGFLDFFFNSYVHNEVNKH